MNNTSKNDSKEEINEESVFEIERIVLSHILNKGKFIEDIFLQLQPSDFGSYENRNIFINLLNFKIEGKDFDLLSLINYYDDNSEMQFNNYREYIIQTNIKFTHQQNIIQFIDIIKNASIKRKFVDFAQTLNSTSIDIISSREKLWSLEQEFLNITNNKKSKEIESIGKIVQEFSKKLEQISSQTELLTGTTSGYASIDKITNGFQGGDLIILAARPGVGKTALAINFLVNATKDILENRSNQENDKDKIALMFSMEMGNLQVCQRIVSIESGVEINAIKTGQLDSLQTSLITDVISNLYNLPLYIDDSSDLSIIDIQSKIKQMSNDKEIKLLVIDYLQLLKGAKTNINMNRQQEVASISRSLKSLARQYNIPVIAIAQLSRKIEERKAEGRKPMLSDLRESGAIEQDADLVCFINYKDMINNENNSSKQDLNNVVVEFIIAKNRNGAIGSVDLVFNKSISKYIDVSFTNFKNN